MKKSISYLTIIIRSFIKPIISRIKIINVISLSMSFLCNSSTLTCCLHVFSSSFVCYKHSSRCNFLHVESIQSKWLIS
nr:MAG TPA: hypothetical protein [Crassvirales sp.]